MLENELEEFNIQLAENETVEEENGEKNDGENKRKLLEKTKIVKQTWSIIEIYQKIKNGKLILDPEYQRNVIWNQSKKVAFIESLFMGIIIPPIYVVEIPGENRLEGSKYEVVDGKQRLSTIRSFLNNELILTAKDLEYYKDIYSSKKFEEIQEDFLEYTNEFLSSVLDVYVITANSPEFTKYDIFARLNKGSEKLKVNEIRKAIYRSQILEFIEEYINSNLDKDFYKELFTTNDIKRYDDYGRFFKSIAYCLRFNPEKKIIEGYNSRPREMINEVLSNIQNNAYSLTKENILDIIEKTVKLIQKFNELDNSGYLIDACIYFAVHDEERFNNKIEDIIRDEEIISTFNKSASTTSNVNKRIQRIFDILNE